MPIIKNIIICVLAVTCALLTARLWFGSFFDDDIFSAMPIAAASMAGHRMSDAMVESAKVAVSLDGQIYEIAYSNLHQEPVWQLSTRAISALINEGTAGSSGIIDGDSLAEIFEAQNIVIQYNFSMPTGFFREQFGQRPGFLSSIFTNFETLVISPAHDGVTFFFINSSSGSFHTFSLQSPQIYYDFHNLFAENAENEHHAYHIRYGVEFLPVRDEALVMEARNPIGDRLLLADVRPFVDFFFPNPAIMDEITVDGIYTYHDNFRIVKFYPSNIVEYNALLSASSSSAASFTSSFLAALDMLDRDAANMQARRTEMNDVFFVGYSIGPREGQWNFYFDYVGPGGLITMGDYTGILEHAVEVRVVNNTVMQYRRLMMYFSERAGF